MINKRQQSIAGRHCWVPAIAGVPLLGATMRTIAGCHCWGAMAGVPWLDASYQLKRGSRWVPLLVAIADMIIRQLGLATGVLTQVGCHWAPLLGAIAGVPPCRVAARCHCSAPLLDAIAGVPLLGATMHAIAGCHCWGAMAGCWVPLREKIGQSDTPFSAASFSTVITHELACAIWGLCWYNSLDVSRDHIRPVFATGPQPPASAASVHGN